MFLAFSHVSTVRISVFECCLMSCSTSAFVNLMALLLVWLRSSLTWSWTPLHGCSRLWYILQLETTCDVIDAIKMNWRLVWSQLLSLKKIKITSTTRCIFSVFVQVHFKEITLCVFVWNHNTGYIVFSREFRIRTENPRHNGLNVSNITSWEVV